MTEAEGEPDVPAEGDLVGGRLRVERVLGAGGMGVVLQAWDLGLERRVAVKVLRSALAARQDMVSRFLREARAAAALKTDHVAHVLETGTLDSGAPYFVMECLEGRDLADVLGERGKLPVGDAVAYVLQACEALAEAHGLGLVHRDLKPANLFLARRPDGSSRIKVLDFGIAKALAAVGTSTDASTTRTGTVMGSVLYMSPEQVRDASRVDARSDIWALGVVLHELIAGRPPFRGESPTAACAAIVADPPASLSDDAPDAPAGLEAVVLRCLDKDVSRRYQDVSELARALQPFAPGGSIIVLDRASLAGGSAAPALRPTSPSPSRRPSRVTLLLAAVVLVAGVVLAGARVRRDASSPAKPAATALTDLPAYGSTNAEAVLNFRNAMAERRAGRARPAIDLLTKAILLDPSFPPPYVELLSMTGTSRAGPEERAQYAAADGLRGAMTPRDRGMLDALEPLVLRVPADWRESETRLRRLTELAPTDVEVFWLLAWVTAGRSLEDAEVAGRRANELDPLYAGVYGDLANYQAYAGHRADAHATLTRCLERIPRAMNCLYWDTALAEEEGRCDALESGARRLLAMDPASTRGPKALVKALAASGSLGAAREALARMPAGSHELTSFNAPSEGLLDLLAGDLAGAEALARQAAEGARKSDTREARAGPTALLVELALEEGRVTEAADRAEDYLARAEAWEPDPDADDFALMSDPTPLLLATLKLAGRIDADELARRRAKWLARWPGRPDVAPYLWPHAFATVALVTEAKEDAGRALDERGRFAPLPEFYPAGLPAAGIGATLVLAGQAREALPWLERATRACRAATSPFEQTRALYWLGQAKEATGDPAGACTAYGAVVARWGGGRPKSATAEHAKARGAALGCTL